MSEETTLPRTRSAMKADVPKTPNPADALVMAQRPKTPGRPEMSRISVYS